jgi:hypothetical protein
VAKAGTELQCHEVGTKRIEGSGKGKTDNDKKMKVMIRRKLQGKEERKRTKK